MCINGRRYVCCGEYYVVSDECDTSVQSPLQNKPTYNRVSIQLHTLIYLKQHTGPLDVSREGGASASHVERTPGRATLTSWVVGPLHSYTQEGLVDNNKSPPPALCNLSLRTVVKLYTSCVLTLRVSLVS